MNKTRTRRALAAENRQLTAQLKAAQGNTRKTLNARVHSTEQENKKLKSEIASLKTAHEAELETLGSRIKKLEEQVKELSAEVSA